MSLTYFFAIFLLTIVVMRVALWFYPHHGPIILGFRPHHYFYGLILIIVSFFTLRAWLLPIGLGLVVDELPLFFIFKGIDWPHNHWKQYHSYESLTSVAGVIIISLIIFFAFHLSPTLSNWIK